MRGYPPFAGGGGAAHLGMLGQDDAQQLASVLARLQDWENFLSDLRFYGSLGSDAAFRNAFARLEQTWLEYFVFSYDFAGAQQVPAGTANARPNAALAFAEISVRTDEQPWELWRASYVATDPRVYVTIRDDRVGRYLHLNTLDLRAVMGLGAPGLTVGTDAPAHFPFRFSDRWRMSPVSLLTILAKDFSGSANTVRISLHGAKINSGQPPWEVDPWSGTPRRVVEVIPFIYPLPDDNTNYDISANATITFSIQMDSDSDFLCDALMGVRDGAATVMLVDGVDRQRRWMDRPVHIDNLVGNGVSPNVFPAFRWLSARSTVMATISDLSGATNQVRLYLRGRKIYYENR